MVRAVVEGGFQALLVVRHEVHPKNLVALKARRTLDVVHHEAQKIAQLLASRRKLHGEHEEQVMNELGRVEVLRLQAHEFPGEGVCLALDFQKMGKAALVEGGARQLLERTRELSQLVGEVVDRCVIVIVGHIEQHNGDVHPLPQLAEGAQVAVAGAGGGHGEPWRMQHARLHHPHDRFVVRAQRGRDAGFLCAVDEVRRCVVSREKACQALDAYGSQPETLHNLHRCEHVAPYVVAFMSELVGDEAECVGLQFVIAARRMEVGKMARSPGVAAKADEGISPAALGVGLARAAHVVHVAMYGVGEGFHSDAFCFACSRSDLRIARLRACFLS